MIEPSGQISNLEVRKSMNGGCTQEALRLIKEVTWIPGQQDQRCCKNSNDYFNWIWNELKCFLRKLWLDWELDYRH